MTRQEYDSLQFQLSRKLTTAMPREMTGKRKEGYEAGILAAKSIIKSFFEKENKNYEH